MTTLQMVQSQHQHIDDVVNAYIHDDIIVHACNIATHVQDVATTHTCAIIMILSMTFVMIYHNTFW